MVIKYWNLLEEIFSIESKTRTHICEFLFLTKNLDYDSISPQKKVKI